MSIGFDATSTGNSSSWSHTCTGSNMVLLVYINYGSAPSALTYNGVALTRLYSGLTGDTDIWYLVNPSNGSHSIVWTGGSGAGQASSYRNVNTASFPASNSGGANGGVYTNTQTVTTVSSNAWIAGIGASRVSISGTSSGLASDKTDRSSTGGGSTGGGVVYGIVSYDSNGTVTPGSNSSTVTFSGGSNPQTYNFLFALEPNTGTLTMGTGMFTLTGKAINLILHTAGRTISMAVGTFTVTFQTFSTMATKLFSAGTGLFTITGYPINFLKKWITQLKDSSSWINRNKD